MKETIQLKKISPTKITICLVKEGEYFYSVLATVNSDGFCDEHNLNLEQVAVNMAKSFSATMGYEVAQTIE